MKRLRTKRISQIFCYVFALLIFNISIDPPDLLVNLDNDVELEEDLNINEMESVAELILEKGFELQDALPESDDPDSDNILKKIHFFNLINENLTLKFIIPFKEIIINSFSYFININTIFFKITSPPPELFSF